jgi:Lecithin:cholesterol acyltransferase.
MAPQTANTLTPAHLHDDQVIALLQSGAHSHLLIALFGEQEYLELSHLAKLAATRRNKRGRLVFILPGIMGSRLAMKRGRTLDLYWLHPHAIAAGHLAKLALPGSRALRPIGVMLPGYLKMKLMLEVSGFKPVLHAFDWRADLERNARSLLRDIERSGASTVTIVAHSMGALIARAALRFETKRRIKQLVQIGAPNDGSFAPVQALRAVYPTVRKIAALDRTHSAEQLAQDVFLTLPGLYQLLPTPRSADELDLFDASNWPSDLAPNSKLLQHARKVRARLVKPDNRCHVIAGYGQDTIVSLARTGEGFTYEIRPEGDGTVPLARAGWEGARSWYARENHGALSTSSDVLAALVDILREGDTSRLTSTLPEPPAEQRSRHVADSDLRRHALTKVDWDTLTVDSRRRILEPIFTPEFITPTD